MTKERFARIGEACRAAARSGRIDETGRRAGALGGKAGGSEMCITNR